MPPSEPAVSFIVPCYNYGRYVGECLASIFAQQGYDDYEVVVVNDGSTDETEQVLRGMTDPRLRVVRHMRNLGHVAAVNRGFSEARGRFIVRVDADDRYRPHYLASVLPKFHDHPDVGIVFGDVALIDSQGCITQPRANHLNADADVKARMFLALLERNVISAATAMARRDAIGPAVPIPSDIVSDDWYYSLTIARRWPFYYVNDVVADIRIHPANHHVRVAADGTEERSVLAVIDRIYSEREESPELEAGKRRLKRRIYAAQFLTSADKYFGHGNAADARRCFTMAIRHQPSAALRAGVMRRLLATMIGLPLYERLKALAKTPAAAGSAHGHP